MAHKGEEKLIFVLTVVVEVSLDLEIYFTSNFKLCIASVQQRTTNVEQNEDWMLRHNFISEFVYLKVGFKLHFRHKCFEYIELLYASERFCLLILESIELIDKVQDDLCLLLGKLFIIEGLSKIEPYLLSAFLWLLKKETLEARGKLREFGEND